MLFGIFPPDGRRSSLIGTRLVNPFRNFKISADAETSEMIRSGQITDRHHEERENYRRKHVYSQWPALTEGQARKKFERRQKLYRILYKAMKMRYVLRYLRRFARC